MGKEDQPCDHKYDIAGSLCENNDKFAVDRMLPKIDMGDLLVIHDTGAHGFSMGYNYNGKLRSAELLLKEDGSVALFLFLSGGGTCLVFSSEVDEESLAGALLPGVIHKLLQISDGEVRKTGGYLIDQFAAALLVHGHGICTG